MALGEFELIRRFFHRAGSGNGDDCAALQPSPGQQWLVSTDMLVEGRHFLSTVDPHALGHKALAVNLSDLAACGAAPRAFFLAVALPQADADWLAAFSRGLFALADAHGIVLAGGDTTRGPLNLCITVMGESPAPLWRRGARVGDDLWVSGTLGDARLALEAFRGTLQLEREAFQACRTRMERPTPRIALGQALRGVASSCIDVSDGLLGDLRHVLEASGVGAVLKLDALPRSPWLAAQDPTMQHRCLLTGGDDYELLFTAAPGAALPDLGLPLSRIGRIVEAPGLFLRDAQGHPVAFDGRGFDHFDTP
ncbi:MAG: thiamine-phosphate kinase [Inhella sp.]|jgi:thiamine-monophosphate kinase|nr:thiamine-phosphate kinase [Inhella sp.]